MPEVMKSTEVRRRRAEVSETLDDSKDQRSKVGDRRRSAKA